jgi:LPXTG-motif cell wall-anchored protein
VQPSGESSEVPSPSAPEATDDDSEPTFFSSAPPTTSSSESQASSSAEYVPFVYTDYASGIATMRIPESFLSGQGWVKPDKTTTTPNPGAPEPTPESTPSPPAPNPDSSSDQAWIAGPVVGGVAGLALVLGIGFWLYRRRKRQRQPSTITDDVPELNPKPTPQQLESTETPKPKHELVGSEGIHSAEMPANEPAGHEMEGERIFEKGASDLPRIRRKPLNPGFATNDG